MNTNKKAITPIVATILLVVVAVILITIILNWGKSFTIASLDKTKTIKTFSVSDAGAFVYPKSFSDGILAINYQPPSTIQEPVIITNYKILEVDMEPVVLSTPITLTNNSTTILDLECMYEYSVTDPKMTIQLITEDNTYITINQRDQGMVCTSGGTGTEEDPKIICNAEDLNDIRTAPDANYSLGKDIDLKCFSRQTEEGWEPLGNLDTNFEGIFEGNNHTINNLYINRPYTEYIGLFGYGYNGSESGDYPQIKNLNLEDVNINGGEYSGSLAGQMDSGAIENCHITGSVSGSAGYVGGLVGYVDSVTIENCNFEGNVSGEDSYVGGLVGVNSSTISNSYFEGDVLGESYLGGLIGHNYGTISNSYFIGNIIGNSYIGGISGYNDGGYISNTNSTGDISGNQNAGGLVGYNSYNSTIENSYSICDVTGSGAYIGGLVGTNVPSGDISNSYCSGDVIGADVVGCLVGYAYEDYVPDENSIGTGDYECTDEECTADCPIGIRRMIH